MRVDLRPVKKELRAAVLARRNAASPDDVRTWSARIADTLCGLPIFATTRTLCSYLAVGQEVHTEPIVRAALDQGKRVVLPRTLPAERRLALHAITRLDQLVPGPYGILEPTPDLPVVDPTEVELFIVPGVVFDTAGNRIGYGAGYYDSLLVLSEGWRVAIAFACQLAAHVPSAEHDMPVDLIITERGIVDCSKGQQAGDHLRLRNMVFYGHHGAFPQEREQGIRFAVDIDLRLDLQWPGLTDELATTVNYPVIFRLIERIQSGREFCLLEAMAEHIATAILQECASVVEVTVTARKFNPPVGGLLDAFEVEISRSRPAWLRPYGA